MKKTVIITGSTSGIGEAFSHRLAEQGYDLVLVARKKKKLLKLAKILGERYAIDVQYIIADLSKENEIHQTEQQLKTYTNVKFLINNAGFGIAGYFNDVPMEEQLSMLNVHLTTTVRFSKAVLPAMINNNSGCIINVASMAAFMNLPGSVMYATTKAAIIKFSQTLQNEVMPFGIKIQALCPGFTPTGFHAARRRDTSATVKSIPDFLWTPIQLVVDTSLNELNSRKVICIPGHINTLIFWTNKIPFVSKWIQTVILRKQAKTMPACPYSMAKN
jgi:short-subunit dehydrogenase